MHNGQTSKTLILDLISKEDCFLTSNSFIFLAINSLYFRNATERSSTGSTRKRIGLSVLRKLKLFVPELPEQNRIVSVLETWDKAIEKLIKKIEVKNKLKKD